MLSILCPFLTPAMQKGNILIVDDNKSIISTLEILLGPEFDVVKGIRGKFLQAGHILGSAQVLLEFEEKKLLYSGDISTRESNLLLPAKPPKEKVDYLVLESTYAGKNDILPSLQKTSKELADIVKSTLKRGGRVLIPSFAVGRGQEVMLTLENYMKT